MNLKKIGIIRGLKPRRAQADFSGSFSKLKSVFLTDKNLGTKNIYGFDPIKLIFGKTTHQSWVGVDPEKLEKKALNLDYLETYELYHFFSGQAAHVSQKLKKPLVTEVWTSFASHPAYFLPPYSFTVQNVIKNTSLFIARSERAKESLAKYGIPVKKIKMLYQGVDLKKFHPAKRKIKNKKIFLYVGEMEKYKGVSVILAAWKEHYAKYPDDRLVMVGKGSFSSLAKKTDGVQALGYVRHNKLPAIYRKANIFLAPSINRYIGPFLWWEEYFSYVLMEAMASGLSIIGSNSGGIPEEIGTRNIIINQKSVSELVSAMERVNIKNPNRKRAQTYFDLHKQTLKLEKIISERLHL